MSRAVGEGTGRTSDRIAVGSQRGEPRRHLRRNPFHAADLAAGSGPSVDDHRGAAPGYVPQRRVLGESVRGPVGARRFRRADAGGHRVAHARRLSKLRMNSATSPSPMTGRPPRGDGEAVALGATVRGTEAKATPLGAIATGAPVNRLPAKPA